MNEKTERLYDFEPKIDITRTAKGSTKYAFVYCENGKRKRCQPRIKECSCPPRRGGCEHLFEVQREFELFKDKITAVRSGDLVSVPKGLTEYLSAIERSAQHTSGTKFIIRNNLEFFSRFCQNSRIIHLADFSEKEAREFSNWISTLKYLTKKGKEKKYSDATLHIILRTTRAFLSYCVNEKWIKENPLSGANKIAPQKIIKAAPEKPKNILTVEEIKKLEKKLDGQWLNMFQLFLYTGMRMEDLRLLKWERIVNDQIHLYEDEETGYRPKWNISRNILITPKLREILDAQIQYQKENRIRSQFVFTTGNNTVYNPNNIRRFFKKCYLKYDILGTLKNGELCIHTFRHTYITNLLKAGIPLPVVSKTVGHSSIKMTMEYFNALTEDQNVLKDFSY